MRRLLRILSAVSLLLCVATAMLWVRSIGAGDQITRVTPAGELRLGSARGLLCVAWGNRYQGRPGKRGWSYGSLQKPQPYDWPYPPGLEHGIDSDSLDVMWGGAGGVAWHAVVLPDWLLCLLLLLLPARPGFRAFVRWRRERLRGRENCCPSCGYNLTANTSGVCQECGRSINSSVSKRPMRTPWLIWAASLIAVGALVYTIINLWWPWVNTVRE